MRAAELVSMLTAHGVRIGHIPGGTPSLTAHDIANALARAELSDFEDDIIRVVYCLEHDRFESLCNWMFLKEAPKHSGLRRIFPRQEIVRDLITFTVFETIYLGLCPRCRGTGIHRNQRQCALCDGSGKYFHNSDWVAEYVLEIPEKQRKACRIEERRRQISDALLRAQANAVAKIERVMEKERHWRSA